MNKKVKFSGLWTAILSVVSVAYIFPISSGFDQFF